MKRSKRLISSLVAVVLMTNSVPMISIANSDKTDNQLASDKISADLHDLMDSANESIPVTIWLDDIETPQLEKQVKDKIGLDITKLENSYTPPSNELLNELDMASNSDSDKNLGILMKNYLKLTESSRKIEKEKTELYLETKRNILSEYHNSQAEQFLEENGITEEETIFISKYAPMIICSISSEKIIQIAESNKVSELSLHQENETTYNPGFFEDLSISLDSLNVGQARTDIGLSGVGEKIGIFEEGVVSLADCPTYGIDPSKVTIIETDNTYTVVPHPHATKIAKIAAGYDGVAPNALIYSASSESHTWGDTPNDYPDPTIAHMYYNLEAMIGCGVHVFNLSYGYSEVVDENNITNMYAEVSKYLDHLIARTGVTIVAIDGNYSNNYITDIASSFNCIAVNGYICKIPNTSTYEELLNDYAFNHGNGCLKPDVIAPSLNSGTSFSAPFICGMVALMYECRPSLYAHPEEVKAILLASCHRKCSRLYRGANDIPSLNETMEQGLTDRQGAGIPDAYKMISILAQHSYGFGDLNIDNSYSRTVNIIQPKYGATNMNVSMAYLHTNVLVSQLQNCDDYNISLDNSYYSTNKTSENEVSSTEMIYANLTNDSHYTLEISKNTGSMSNVRYGYAWSTDNASLHPYINIDDDENYDGIYLLKNKNSEKYLTMNDNTLKAYQTNYTGGSNQFWIAKKSAVSGNYCLMSANGNDKNLEIGSVISGAYYSANGSNTSTAMLLTCENDGTYTLKRTTPSITYGLGIYNNSSNSGTAAAWYSFSSSNESQRWYLEAVEYKKGDVNRDGVISSVDAGLALDIYVDIATGQDTSSNLDKYLADYDNNGQVTSADATAILNHTT